MDKPVVDKRVDRWVAGLGMAAVLAVVLWGVLGKDTLAQFAGSGLDLVTTKLSWFFVVAADIFLVAAVFLAFSRFGRIRLAPTDDEQPEFSMLAWIAMMFSGGMGIGLVFYAVAEPILHYADPPPASGVAPQTNQAAAAAMQYTLFHWTLHPWAIYAIAGLALAYATFRKGRGNRISAAFQPLLGSRADGVPGKAIDLLAVLATVFGTATSLGLGALQIAAGLGIVAGVADETWVELVIIGTLTAAFVLSAFSGVHRGIKWLSTLNVVLALILMLFVFLAGPTVQILNVIPPSIGDYLSNLLVMSTRTGAFTDPGWMGTWTIFYWAWWLSWAPFVGTFIARISRGRTVREFVIGVLLIPSGASVIWFAVMGGSALKLQADGVTDLIGATGQGVEHALFNLLEALPLATVTSILAMVLIGVYFITGADSASLVLGALSSRGALHPARPLVVAWGVLIGAVAAVLLLAGGLTVLQHATILVALPFAIVMLALIIAVLRDMSTDPMARPHRRAAAHGLRDAVRRLD